MAFQEKELILSDITSTIIDFSRELICRQANAALDAAPDHLTALADQTSFPEERTIYLDAMHDLSFARKKVYGAFETELLDALQVFKTNEVAAKYQTQGGVVTNFSGAKEMEEKLALETMLSKAKSNAEVSLQNVVRSINAMMGSDWTKRHYNPIAPEYIIRAWVAAISQMRMDAKGNLAMYGILDTQLLKLLPDIYEKLGGFLESLASKRSSRPDKESSAQESGDGADSDSNDFEAMFGDIDSAGTEDGFDSSSEQAIDDDDDPAEEINTKQLIQALDKLQHDRSLDDSHYYASNYLLDYRQLMSDYKVIADGTINPWTIGQINDDVIDMTRLMFSFILDDYHLPDDIRFHVSRLQIPLLKLGLNDKYLFLSKEHPARQLIMDITQSVDLWDPDHSGGLDILLNKVIATIDDVLETYATDDSLFEALHLDFRAFLDGDSDTDEGIPAHTKQHQSERSKADNVKLHVESTLGDICKGKRIPPVIEKILENYWANLLFLEYIKAGEEAEDYQEYIETSEMLVESVQPKYTEAERKEMAKQLPIIVKRLKAGFSEIGVVSFESVDLFRELQQCHMEVLKEHPENLPIQEFEVDEDEYTSFREDQEASSFVWDREAIEASMLEDNIERSMSMSDSDPSAFDDNPNIIRRNKRTDVDDAAVSSADRERQIIDDELREARDAYESALQDHKDKKSREAGNTPEEENFMAMFFEDPDFEKKQLSSKDEKNDEYDDIEVIDEPEPFDDLDSREDIDIYTNEIDISELGDLSDLDDDDDELKNKDYLEVGNVVETDEQSNSDDVGLSVELEPGRSKPSPELKSEPEPEPKSKEQLVIQKRAQGALDKEEGMSHLEDKIVEELIERLKVGLWIDLYHADGEKVRAKIMAIVPTVGKYIFGDRSGRKIADFNRQNLYDAIQTGRIRLDEIDTAYDKTLESVIANLRVMKKAEDD